MNSKSLFKGRLDGKTFLPPMAWKAVSNKGLSLHTFEKDMQNTSLDIQAIRRQFPALHQEVNKRPLVYFDNAATTQKPQSVIDTLIHYYRHDNANIHRGIHTLAERATAAYEDCRKSAAQFINAKTEEIVFTKGTTEGINLLAASLRQGDLKAGDEIILSELEHHSNIVPWQLLCEEKGSILKVIPIDETGALDMAVYEQMLSEKTQLVAVNYISNALGTVNPIKQIIEKAHQTKTAKVLVDAAQAAPHVKIDVQDLDCDFLTFSAHKMYGPTGVGVLYGKSHWLKALPPYQGGGEMIKEVHFSGTTFNDIPHKFEAGTPNIAGVIAFKAAIDFVEHIGVERIAAHENELLNYATDLLSEVKGFIPVGTSEHKAAVISFLVHGMHPFDLGQWLDARGIAIRTGHHCAQPLMDKLGIDGTARASFALYNTQEEIKHFVDTLNHIISKMK